MKSALIKKYITPFCFLSSGIISLYFFIQSIYKLLREINENIVLVNLGSYYMLGASIGLLSLSSLFILDQWSKKSISKYWSNLIQKIFLFGFILLFILPHIINYFVSSYLVDNGYQICEAASRSWLYIHKIVYVHPPQECYKTLVYP